MRASRGGTLRGELASAVRETSLRFAAHGVVAAALVVAALFSAR